MSAYQYTPLPPDTTRLLQLLPVEEPQMIRCKLFEYPLRSDKNVSPSYEALSYVWGDQTRLRTIYVDDQALKVTENLYHLLLRLRPHYFPRVIWVDAICIEQTNTEDKARQIQLMTEIYAKARSVLVWLGEAENDAGDSTLDVIRRAGDGSQLLDAELYQRDKQAVLRLLKRSWFRRIWVLQEVAAARHISIMCGSAEIDGHAFCLGLDFFEISITQVTFLMRRAIFRSKQIPRDLVRMSLNICSLGELVDMYHHYEATIPQDKVYALLGMCLDNVENAGLRPDYAVKWNELMSSLVKFILGDQALVNVLHDKEVAFIKITGRVIGKICHVETNQALGAHSVRVLVKSISEQVKAIGTNDYTDINCCHRSHTTLPLSNSAIPLQKGDLLCLLQGSSKPTIIRLRNHHCVIIMIAAAIVLNHKTPIENVGEERKNSKCECITRKFWLVWDWKLALGIENGTEATDSMLTNSWESFENESPSRLRDITGIWDAAYILEDSGENAKARVLFQEAVTRLEALSGRTSPEMSKVLAGRSILSWAAENGQDAIVRLLLESEAEIEAKDKVSRRSPLSWASENGHEAVVEQLLGADGVEVDSKDINDRTPLSWACENGHEAVVKQLIVIGKAEVDIADRFQRTPLSWAVANGHDSIVRQLLKHDVTIDSKDKYEQTPLSYAALYRYNSMIELFQPTELAEVELMSPDQEPSFISAAKYGHKFVIKRLLDISSAGMESKDAYGRTPLALAAAEGHEAVVKLLLETEAAVESMDEDSWMPLGLAAANGHEAVVRLLLDAKADIEFKDDGYSWTPLAMAAVGGHEAVVKLLLEAKADVESEDSYKQTPLALAAVDGHEAVVRLLLEAKANVESKDIHGKTPLALAAQNGYEAVVRLLLEAKADVEWKDEDGWTPLALAAEEGREAVARLLLENKANIESEDGYSRTPLALAAAQGHAAVVRLLLENKANIESKDRRGHTPLALAAENGQTAAVKLLLKAKADVQVKDEEDDRTTLHMAAANGHEAVVRLLLETEVNVESEDGDNLSPLVLATAGGHDAVVELLFEAKADVEAKGR